jgi:hypothetical protein
MAKTLKTDTRTPGNVRTAPKSSCQKIPKETQVNR